MGSHKLMNMITWDIVFVCFPECFLDFFPGVLPLKQLSLKWVRGSSQGGWCDHATSFVAPEGMTHSLNRWMLQNMQTKRTKIHEWLSRKALWIRVIIAGSLPNDIRKYMVMYDAYTIVKMRWVWRRHIMSCQNSVSADISIFISRKLLLWDPQAQATLLTQHPPELPWICLRSSDASCTKVRPWCYCTRISFVLNRLEIGK